MASLSAKDFLTEWLVSKKPTVTEGTYSSYEEKVISFLEFLEKRGSESLDAVTVREVETFRGELIKLGISPTTINLKLKMIGTAFRHAQKLGYVSVNPFEIVSPLPARNAEKQAFSLDQLQALLKTADEDWKGMILVGVCTGARIGDAAVLEWKNVNLKRGTIVYFPGKKRKKELTKPHEAVILPDLKDYLEARQKQGGSQNPETALFPALARRSVSGDSGLSLTFRALMDKVGIPYEILREPEKGSKGRRVYSLGYHSLRHSCTSLMANIGVSEEIRKKLIGHTSDVHQRYTHFEVETFKRELKKFPRLNG